MSTKTKVRQEALGELRRLMGDRDRGFAAPDKKVYYGDLRAALLSNYMERGNKSLHTYADGTEGIPSLKPLDKFFSFSADAPGVPVSLITTDAAREFVRQRQVEGMGNAVINRSLSALRRMLRIAHEDGKLQFVPVIRLLKEPPARKGFLPLDKFEQLAGLLPSHLRPLVTLLYYCGVRLGEALEIEWSQVDLDRRIIRLEAEQTKGDEARNVPMPGVLVNMLEEITPKEGKAFSAVNLTKEWRKACAGAGLGIIIDVPGKPHDPQYKGLIIHDLRRSAIRNLVNAGVPERVAMRISGHKTRSVFDRYHIVSTDDVSSAMRRLEATTVQPVSETLVKKSPKKVRKSLMALSSRG
ncbi:MAG: tyrosine-type recombinase/integrase [Acidobacteriia bacterium]|nr:tyrosine-type recombinase/integrase [Terriglobia bacterium]